MPPSCSEIGDSQIVEASQVLDFFPDPRHRAGVEHLQLEPAHAFRNGSTVQFHNDGESRDLPHCGLDPGPFEDQLILVALALEMIGREAKAFEPGHKFRTEHLPLAIKHIAAQPRAFTARQRQRSDVIQLLLERADIDHRREGDMRRSVDDAEGDLGRAMPPEDCLRHQELVEIGIQHRPHDRVDFPIVIVDAGGDIGHGEGIGLAVDQ